MNRFRGIIAAFLAILIVSPLCCCASMVKVEQTSSHSCCGESKEKSKKDSSCECTAKAHRSVDVDAKAPSFHPPVVLALPPSILSIPETEAAMVVPGVSGSQWQDTGPPGWRLIRLQRLLI